jgi:pimeloyl-ACP methyl ester carboxylesterase
MGVHRIMSPPIIGQTLTVGSQAVHCLFSGRGRRTVVLLHGYASLAQEIAAAFPPQEGVRFLAFDGPGYGLSDPLPADGPGGPASQAAWLAAALDALSVQDCVVVAHSLGSSVALWLAARRPDLVSHLILLAPFCRPTRKLAAGLLHAAIQPGIGPLISDRLLPRMASVLGPRFLRSVLFPNPVPAYLADFPFVHAARPGALKLMARDYLGFQRDMTVFDRRRRLPCPIRVIFGTMDLVAVPQMHLAWLQELEAVLDIDLVEGVGHAPHHARPDLMKRALDAVM